MKKPDFSDAIFESFFVGGYVAAAANGRISKPLMDEYGGFYQSMDRGSPLVAFCHFVDTYCGDRNKLIDRLDDDSLAEVVNLIFFARNAYVHNAWHVESMKFENQKKKLREASEQGKLHDKAPNFSIVVDEDDRLHINNLMSICMAIADSIKPSQDS